jgi:hypothetical protein
VVKDAEGDVIGAEPEESEGDEQKETKETKPGEDGGKIDLDARDGLEAGDVPGHEFHGNQWTEAAAGVHQHLKREADQASTKASDTEFNRNGSNATNEEISKAHQEAYEKYKAVAEHAKQFEKTRALVRNMNQKAGEHKRAADYYLKQHKAALKGRDAGPSEDLERSGVLHYAAAVAHDMQAMAEECQALLSISDDRIFAQRAVALMDKLDALKQDILTLPKSAQALAEVQFAALANGLDEAKRKGKK